MCNTHFVKQPTGAQDKVILWHAENLKIAESFDPCQPARTAQADMYRYFHRYNMAALSQNTAQMQMLNRNLFGEKETESIEGNRIKIFPTMFSKAFFLRLLEF